MHKCVQTQTGKCFAIFSKNYRVTQVSIARTKQTRNKKFEIRSTKYETNSKILPLAPSKGGECPPLAGVQGVDLI
ncbi:MAG: hypothetical protein A2W17_06895 [Planctomycetes bacterium RBG_16_41_13]|nr:MAG: hypothetical protein A2W17_06895 [Planctomycetes bacterium RBG_16_41_13]